MGSKRRRIVTQTKRYWAPSCAIEIGELRATIFDVHEPINDTAPPRCHDRRFRWRNSRYNEKRER